jgi:hypothetical protein
MLQIMHKSSHVFMFLNLIPLGPEITKYGEVQGFFFSFSNHLELFWSNCELLLPVW